MLIDRFSVSVISVAFPHAFKRLLTVVGALAC
jgi:hypothetical protein